MYELLQHSNSFEIIAACEEDGEARAFVEQDGRVEISHDSFRAMLREADFDVLAVGDYFSKRGGLIREALSLGKRIVSDKPICTSIADLDAIESLCEKSALPLGANLVLRDSGTFIRVRELILSNEIGEILSIYFNGNHPLQLGRRPQWYFEEGRHGGTINDLGVHAFDLIPWITGETWRMVNAARTWNVGRIAPAVGGFQEAAQVMMTMANGCGVLGDLSYLVPDSFSYDFPQYWRFVFTGTTGVIEAALNQESIVLYKGGETEARLIEPAHTCAGGYLDSFLREIEGRSGRGDLTTADVISATRVALRSQNAADERVTDMLL